jgi:hypothetical protein
MATRAHHDLSIVEAVETLSSIADLEFDREIGIAQKHEIVLGNEKIAYKTVHWLHKEDAPATVNLVRETFRVILHYLKQFYKKEYGSVTDQKTLEGIKTIMVLVGEAAKKLDKYTQIFHQTQSVTDFKEYKQLQEFYRSKIARKIDEGVLTKWSVALTQGKLAKGIAFRAAPKKTDKLTDTKHVFVDLETVKKDTEYELFFIRKEDGSRFFSPRLLRNIKLVCDFGSYFGERKELDPLEQVKQWYDRTLHTCARQILKVLGSRLNHFFHETRKIKDHELVETLKKAFLALMLSSHAQNLLRHHPAKSCAEYFEDFQGFLREALQTSLYQKWIVYPPKEDNKLAHDLMDIVHILCRTLFANLQGLEDMKPIIQGLIQEANARAIREHVEEGYSSQKIWSRLSGDYAAMAKLLRHHPNGPLFKVLELLEENPFHVFDPLLQHNIPNQLFDLYAHDKRYPFLRIPAPIYQEFINRAIVNDEFKGFLLYYSNPDVAHKHLLINLQDRTAWREHVRCLALEELQKVPELQDALTVVTLATDTDFYHQLAPYHQVNHAHLFKEQFKELLLDEHAGYFFPSTISREELEQFIDQAFEVIHRIFFSSKNVLVRDNRLDFIEIFYLLLQLKLIEWTQPDTVSLTCKDSIDIGEAYSAEIFAFLKLINNQEWTDVDWEHLNFMLYAPALLIRERVMLPERFNRMVSALKAVENARYEFGSENFAKIVREGFVRIFKTPILHSQILLPR